MVLDVCFGMFLVGVTGVSEVTFGNDLVVVIRADDETCGDGVPTFGVAVVPTFGLFIVDATGFVFKGFKFFDVPIPLEAIGLRTLLF